MNFLSKTLLKYWLSRKANLFAYVEITQDQIIFELNQNALRKIREAKARHYYLYIPCLRKIALLHHILLHTGVVNLKKRKKVDIDLLSGLKLSGLIFETHYSDKQRTQDSHDFDQTTTNEKQNLLRSVIAIDGDIINQIARDSLQNPYFLEISAAHHWLTNQLLNQLRANLNWIPRLIWLGFAFGSTWGWSQQEYLASNIEKHLGYLVLTLLLGVLWMLLPQWLLRISIYLIFRF